MKTLADALVLPLAVFSLLADSPILAADCNANGIEDANETEIAFEPMARKATRVADNVVVVDLNGDRAPDVVTLRSSAIAVFLQASPWVLGDPLVTELPVEQRDIAAADLDGDGVEEIVTAGREGVVVLRSREGGGLEVRQSLPIVEPVTLRLVDLDADGRLDVVTGNFQDPPTVSVALNDGSANLRVHRNFAAGSGTPRFLDAADLDGDGDVDLGILDNFDLLVMENDGSAGFSRILSSPLEKYPFRGPFLADLEGDGDTDVMALASNQVLVLRNDGCDDSGDADDDGRLAITDAIGLLNHLFLGGLPPDEPFDRCSTDPTREDGLSCGRFAGC